MEDEVSTASCRPFGNLSTVKAGERFQNLGLQSQVMHMTWTN